MARQLHAAGEQVEPLILFDTSVIGPTQPRVFAGPGASRLPSFELSLDWHLGNMLLRSAADGARYLREVVNGRVNRTLHRLGLRAEPEREDEALGARAVWEANRRALSTYEMRSYPGPVTMLLSREEPARTFYDRRLAWADLAQGGLTIRLIPGSHETMLSAEYAPEVARVITRCLAEREGGE
jgi:thioesterase domain-containing protein